MQHSVQIPWHPGGGGGAPIQVPARPMNGGAQSPYILPPPQQADPRQAVPSYLLQPSSYLAPPSTSLGGYHDARTTQQQRSAEAAVTYTPGPSVPDAAMQRRHIPAPDVGMKYAGGATGSERNHGTSFSVEEASKHLRSFQLWSSCYGCARTLGYFLAVVVLLLLAVVADVLPLDAAADAIDPSREHGSAVHKLERQLSKQQSAMNGASRDRSKYAADMDRRLHKKLRKKALKQAKNFARKQPNTRMSKLARGEAVVSEFMRDPEEFVEDKDAVLEVTRSTVGPLYRLNPVYP